MAFGGQWESWTPPDNKILRNYVIITASTTAVSADDIAGLHDRMPLVLKEKDWAACLSHEPGDVTALPAPPLTGLLRTWPVSRAVNNVRNDGVELIEPGRDGDGAAPVGGPNSA